MIRIVQLALGATIVVLTAKIFETKEDASVLDESIESNTNGQIEPEQNYKRGDRFFCPDTGTELQVRAVGGRPRKNSILYKDSTC